MPSPAQLLRVWHFGPPSIPPPTRLVISSLRLFLELYYSIKKGFGTNVWCQWVQGVGTGNRNGVGGSPTRPAAPLGASTIPSAHGGHECFSCREVQTDGNMFWELLPPWSLPCRNRNLPKAMLHMCVWLTPARHRGGWQREGGSRGMLRAPRQHKAGHANDSFAEGTTPCWSVSLLNPPLH